MKTPGHFLLSFSSCRWELHKHHRDGDMPVAGPCQYHKKRRRVHFIGIDFGCHCFQTFVTFLNEFVPSQLDFKLWLMKQKCYDLAEIPIQSDNKFIRKMDIQCSADFYG